MTSLEAYGFATPVDQAQPPVFKLKDVTWLEHEPKNTTRGKSNGVCATESLCLTKLRGNL